MTFLNPALLWGLLAVSIPVIIHIFNLKRTKKIEFSTLMFLKEIQQSKYKKIKLKQLLILLCRIAFIIFIVLAFSRPFEKGYLFAGSSKAASCVLLILDDSFSMLNRETQGSEFDAAKKKMIESLSIFDENDEIYFATVSSISKADKNFLYKSINALKDSITNARVSDITRDIGSVLYYAKKITEQSSNSNKEIFLLTDGQKTFFDDAKSSAGEINLKETTKLNIVLSGSRKGNNLSVDTVNVITKIFQKNKPVKVKATLTNHNPFNVSNKSVVLSFSGKNSADEKVIDIPANSSVDVEFSFISASSGFTEGSVELLQKEIADDEIPNDNKNYFTFYTPGSIKILLAAESPADLVYLKLALASSEELLKDSAGSRNSGIRSKFFDIKEISASDLSHENLADYNSVIISNKNKFTSDESSKLKDYVNGGGGVLIFPGENTAIDSYNNSLFKELDIPYIISKFSVSASDRALKFENIDLSHPVFDGMFNQNSNIKDNILRDSPDIKNGFEITTSNNARTLISLNANKNFLIEYSRGKGKVLLFASAADMKSSNFPAKNIFSPIVIRSILYLAPVNTIIPATTGKDYYFDLSGFKHADSSKFSVSPLNTNEKDKFIYTIEQTGDGAIYNFKTYLNFNSNYKVEQKSAALYEFPSNFEKAESLLDKYTFKETLYLLKDIMKINANVISPEKNLTSEIMDLRTGKEIWQYALILALLMLLTEFVIARSIKV